MYGYRGDMVLLYSPGGAAVGPERTCMELWVFSHQGALLNLILYLGEYVVHSLGGTLQLISKDSLCYDSH